MGFLPKKKPVTKAKGSKKPAVEPPASATEGEDDSSAEDGDDSSAEDGDDSPPSDPPKIVLKDRHALRDPKAKAKVKCKITQNIPAAGGGMSQLRKGREVMVPAHAVEDLRRAKCIY